MTDIHHPTLNLPALPIFCHKPEFPQKSPNKKNPNDSRKSPNIKIKNKKQNKKSRYQQIRFDRYSSSNPELVSRPNPLPQAGISSIKKSKWKGPQTASTKRVPIRNTKDYHYQEIRFDDIHLPTLNLPAFPILCHKPNFLQKPPLADQTSHAHSFSALFHKWECVSDIQEEYWCILMKATFVSWTLSKKIYSAKLTVARL